MARLIASIALSLDNFIAYKDGDTDWIPAIVSKSIMTDLASAEVVLMGAKTYNEIIEHHGYWPYQEKRAYVISHFDTGTSDNVTFLVDNPMKSIQNMKASLSGDLFVMGGGEFITSLINNGLLDKVTVYLTPILLGVGIPFIGETTGSKFTFTECKLNNGIIKISYVPEK